MLCDHWGTRFETTQQQGGDVEYIPYKFPPDTGVGGGGGGLISQPWNPWASQVPYPIDQWGVLIEVYLKKKNYFISLAFLK
jgi:hypothetical protein